MNQSRKTILILFAIVVLVGLGALLCQVSGTTQGGSPLPTSAVQGTAPSRAFLSLGSAVLTQTGKAPDFTITTEIPIMNGSDDAHVVAFNKAVSAAVQKQVEAFKTSLKQVNVQSSSSFNLSFTPAAQTKHLVSLQLVVDQALDGAAQPTRHTVGFNYDLEHDREISLDQLFLKGANYLQVLSETCKTELAKRQIGFETRQRAADPILENYRSWNLTTDSLVLNFDAGLVADQSAGPQTVFVPYSALKSLIDPQGPLAELAR